MASTRSCAWVSALQEQLFFKCDELAREGACFILLFPMQQLSGRRVARARRRAVSPGLGGSCRTWPAGKPGREEGARRRPGRIPVAWIRRATPEALAPPALPQRWMIAAMADSQMATAVMGGPLGAVERNGGSPKPMESYGLMLSASAGGLLRTCSRMVGAVSDVGRSPREDFVQDGPQSIDVAFWGEPAAQAPGLLGRHVGRRAGHMTHDGLVRAVLAPGRLDEVDLRCYIGRRAHHLGETPIQDQGLAMPPNHDVAGLEVAVEHSPAVGDEMASQARRRVSTRRWRVQPVCGRPAHVGR